MTGNTIPNFSNLGFLPGEQQECQRIDQDRAEGTGTHAHTGLRFEPGARFRTHRETLFTARSLPPVRDPGMAGDREAGGREGSSEDDEEEGRHRERNRWAAEEENTGQRRTEETIMNLRKEIAELKAQQNRDPTSHLFSDPDDAERERRATMTPTGSVRRAARTPILPSMIPGHKASPLNQRECLSDACPCPPMTGTVRGRTFEHRAKGHNTNKLKAAIHAEGRIYSMG